MSIDAAVRRARERAEAIMTDTCVVKRQTGMTYNPVTKMDEPVYTTLYTGRCRLQEKAKATIIATGLHYAGEAEHGVSRWELQVPVNATTGALKRLDVAVITASVEDPAIVGLTLTITGEHSGSHKSMRRIPCEAEVD